MNLNIKKVSKDILSFADYIYSDSHIFLNRKYQEFKKYGFV